MDIRRKKEKQIITQKRRFLQIIHAFLSILEDPQSRDRSEQYNLRRMWKQLGRYMLCHPGNARGIGLSAQIGNFLRIVDDLKRTQDLSFLDRIDFQLCFEGVLRDIDQALRERQRHRRASNPIPIPPPQDGQPRIPQFDDNDFSDNPRASIQNYLQTLFFYYQHHIRRNVPLDDFVGWVMDIRALDVIFDMLQNPKNNTLRQKTKVQFQAMNVSDGRFQFVRDLLIEMAQIIRTIDIHQGILGTPPPPMRQKQEKQIM